MSTLKTLQKKIKINFKNEKILFLHTGGSTALFAYEKMLLDA